jgi:hypothetical protein
MQKDGDHAPDHETAEHPVHHQNGQKNGRGGHGEQTTQLKPDPKHAADAKPEQTTKEQIQWAREKDGRPHHPQATERKEQRRPRLGGLTQSQQKNQINDRKGDADGKNGEEAMHLLHR